MDARLSRAALLFAVTVLCTGADYRTENFIVRCSDPAFGKQVAHEAERFRRELAIEWLGHELPPWEAKCPILVKFEKHASGKTAFSFRPGFSGQGVPCNWDMEVNGPRDRILDAVLPHEVTHAIFATHFGEPLPRWADEGACTTVEHESERRKHKQMLVEFLINRRGIPFNRMFHMMQYPSDILPLYAQGHSVADFLIQHKGKRHFVDFVDAGLAKRNWDAVIDEFYGYDDLSDLQLTWNEWVRQGSEPLVSGELPSSMASFASNEATSQQPATQSYDEPYEGTYAAAPSNGNRVMGEQVASASARSLQLNGPSGNSVDSQQVSSKSWYFAVKQEHVGNQNGEVSYRHALLDEDYAIIQRAIAGRGLTFLSVKQAETQMTPIPLRKPVVESRRETGTLWR